jgi:hypothetical protein
LCERREGDLARAAGETRMKHHDYSASGCAPFARKVTGVLLWACGIAAGIFGGNYGLPVALALFVAGFFIFVSAPAGKSRH